MTMTSIGLKTIYFLHLAIEILGPVEIKKDQILEKFSDQECAEKVAQHFASVSQEYEPVDKTCLPCYLPAEKPPQVLGKIKDFIILD